MDPSVPFRVRPRVRHPRTLPAFDVEQILASASVTPSEPPPVTSEPPPSSSAPPLAPSEPPPSPSGPPEGGTAVAAFFEVEGVVGGRFHLEERIDEGEPAPVWTAFDTFVGREVLVELGGDADVASASAFGDLYSPHVVAPCAAGSTAGEGFLAVPRVHGETLSERLAREGRLAPQECARILSTVTEGLAAVHERGLVHGAIDAQSVFLVRALDPAERPRAVLLAPGVARLVAADRSSASAVPPSLRAPEELHDGGADARTDLFALAGVLYLALTGRQPFVGRTPAEVKQHVLTGSFDPPSRLRRSLPLPLDAFFRRALAVDPARRFASARELGAVFRMVVDDDTRAGVSDPPPPPRSSTALRVGIARGLRFAAIAAVVAAIAIIAFWRLLRTGDEAEAATPPALVP